MKKCIASVEKQADGRCKVTYRGIDRGTWLPLGDMQKCAIHVLQGLLRSAPMKDMLS